MMTQYIIDEEDVAWLKEELLKRNSPYHESFINKIRSILYTPQSYGNFIQDRCKCKKNECVDYKSELCSPWKCNHYLKSSCKDEREKVLDKLLNRVNNISETADLSCHDGYTGGMYSTDVIRISYLEEEMEKLRQSKEERG